jgi:hypothetical protein
MAVGLRRVAPLACRLAFFWLNTSSRRLRRLRLDLGRTAATERSLVEGPLRSGVCDFRGPGGRAEPVKLVGGKRIFVPGKNVSSRREVDGRGFFLGPQPAFAGTGLLTPPGNTHHQPSIRRGTHECKSDRNDSGAVLCKFVVVAGESKDLDLDFNACSSIVQQGNGKCRLKPVLHAGAEQVHLHGAAGQTWRRVNPTRVSIRRAAALVDPHVLASDENMTEWPLRRRTGRRFADAELYGCGIQGAVTTANCRS